MKRIIFIFGFILAFSILPMHLFAGEQCPKVAGSDCLVPEGVIEAIPGFNPSLPVYAACDSNGWFVIKGKATSPVKEKTQMIKEGAVWRARNMRGVRFHPVQLDSNGNPVWAKLENVYTLQEPCIDTSGSGPCFLCK